MDDDKPKPLLFDNGVDDMTMAEYLRSVRTLTEAEVNEITHRKAQLDFSAADLYAAHQGHDEAEAAHH